MKINRISVLGQEVKIEYVDLGVSSNYGEYHDDCSTILIDKNLSEDIMMQTLLHEVVHVVCARLGISGQSEFPALVEEVLAETFSKAIIQNFRLLPMKKS